MLYSVSTFHYRYPADSCCCSTLQSLYISSADVRTSVDPAPPLVLIIDTRKEVVFSTSRKHRNSRPRHLRVTLIPNRFSRCSEPQHQPTGVFTTSPFTPVVSFTTRTPTVFTTSSSEASDRRNRLLGVARTRPLSFSAPGAILSLSGVPIRRTLVIGGRRGERRHE